MHRESAGVLEGQLEQARLGRRRAPPRGSPATSVGVHPAHQIVAHLRGLVARHGAPAGPADGSLLRARTAPRRRPIGVRRCARPTRSRRAPAREPTTSSLCVRASAPQSIVSCIKKSKTTGSRRREVDDRRDRALQSAIWLRAPDRVFDIGEESQPTGRPVRRARMPPCCRTARRTSHARHLRFAPHPLPSRPGSRASATIATIAPSSRDRCPARVESTRAPCAAFGRSVSVRRGERYPLGVRRHYAAFSGASPAAISPTSRTACSAPVNGAIATYASRGSWLTSAAVSPRTMCR